MNYNFHPSEVNTCLKDILQINMSHCYKMLNQKCNILPDFKMNKKIINTYLYIVITILQNK